MGLRWFARPCGPDGHCVCGSFPRAPGSPLDAHPLMPDLPAGSQGQPGRNCFYLGLLMAESPVVSHLRVFVMFVRLACAVAAQWWRTVCFCQSKAKMFCPAPGMATLAARGHPGRAQALRRDCMGVCRENGLRTWCSPKPAARRMPQEMCRGALPTTGCHMPARRQAAPPARAPNLRRQLG
jgi:hypothetical protein